MAAIPTLNSCRQATSERVEPIEDHSAHHEPLGSQQVPLPSAKTQQPGRFSDETLEAKSDEKIDQHRNREDTHRAQHGVSGAASASESCIDQRESCSHERNQKDANHADGRCCLGECCRLYLHHRPSLQIEMGAEGEHESEKLNCDSGQDEQRPGAR